MSRVSRLKVSVQLGGSCTLVPWVGMVRQERLKKCMILVDGMGSLVASEGRAGIPMAGWVEPVKKKRISVLVEFEKFDVICVPAVLYLLHFFDTANRR